MLETPVRFRFIKENALTFRLLLEWLGAPSSQCASSVRPICVYQINPYLCEADRMTRLDSDQNAPFGRMHSIIAYK